MIRASLSGESGNPAPAPSLVSTVDRSPEAMAAFRRAVEAESEGLLRFVTARFGREDAEDTVQEAIALALQYAGSYDPARPVGPWLRTIAVRCRPRRTESVVGPAEPPRTAPPASQEVDQRDAVAGILAHVPPADAELVRRHHVEGQSVSDLARDAGVATGTIKARLFRARKRLALALGGGGALCAWLLLRGAPVAPEPPPAPRILHASVVIRTEVPPAPALATVQLTTRRVVTARPVPLVPAEASR